MSSSPVEIDGEILLGSGLVVEAWRSKLTDTVHVKLVDYKNKTAKHGFIIRIPIEQINEEDYSTPEGCEYLTVRVNGEKERRESSEDYKRLQELEEKAKYGTVEVDDKIKGSIFREELSDQLVMQIRRRRELGQHDGYGFAMRFSEEELIQDQFKMREGIEFPVITGMPVSQLNELTGSFKAKIFDLEKENESLQETQDELLEEIRELTNANNNT